MASTDRPSIRAHHCGISVPDLEAAILWYRDMLGFDLECRDFLVEAHAKVAILSLGDFRVELFEVEGAKPLPEERLHPNLDLQTHGTKHLCLEVDDLAAWVSILKSKDVAIAMEPRTVGTATVAFIRDNAGILIELTDNHRSDGQGSEAPLTGGASWPE